MIYPLALVALGGAIGSAARFLVNLAALRAFGAGFPVGTLAVNVAGCVLMGMLSVWLLGPKGSPPVAPFLMTGVLGGFTTFSAFALDAVSLWQRGDHGAGVAYVLGSVILSLGGLLFGMAIARGMSA